MSTSFPGALDALTNPAATDGLTGHAAQHANANDAIEALEAKVGVDNSTDPASLDYRVATLESGGGGGIWGSITGALSDQTDLQAALNGKLSASATTDAIAEGSSNLYFTAARVRDAVLTGLSTATNAVIAATDSVLTAFGKLQAQISGHTSSTANPHSVTKTQVGLGNVDNTSDLNKPVSTAQAAADVSTLNAAKADATTKANAAQAAAIAASTPIAHVGAGGAAHANAVAAGAAGFMTGEDKTKLDGIAPGANNYTHPTGDGNLHVPATGTTNNGKVLKAGATAGSLSWETLAKADVGLANVDNTSDANKPVSTAQQIALDGKVDEVNPSTSETFTHSGDVVMSGSGKRITGDFSNATIANRLMFQTSIPSGTTSVGVIPAVGAGASNISVFSNSDPLNSDSQLQLLSTVTETSIRNISPKGAGYYTPMSFYTGGAERMVIDPNGHVGLGMIPLTDGGVLQLPTGNGFQINGPHGTVAGNIYYASGWKYAANGNAGYIKFGSDLTIALELGCAGQTNLSGAGAVAPVSVGAVLTNAGALLSVSPTGGLGYGPGAGGTVTQSTSKSTAVTLNKPCGRINTHTSTLEAGVSVEFTLNSTCITPTDTVIVNMVWAIGPVYRVEVAAVGGHAAGIRITNISTYPLSESVPLNFAVIKGATS